MDTKEESPLIKVDPNEILFIRSKAPYGMLKTLANNIGMEYPKVRNEFITLKEEYRNDLITEARRLLEANTGLVYLPHIQAAS